MIYNEDCLIGYDKIEKGSVKLGIYDPPFGISETEFDKHYKRDNKFVIEGYKEVPKEQYEIWTYEWMKRAYDLLHDDGSMYVFMGHTNLRHLLNAAHKVGLHEINHCIWKYNFGVNTTRKYVTSHYHVLYYSKSEKSKVIFNTNCRFGSQERTDDGRGSLLYRDLEDVFVVNKDFDAGEKKNENKLPNELIQKLVLYSSNPGDLVCDFFMGNFTTAYAAIGLGRQVCGFEINKNAYDFHMEIIKDLQPGHLLGKLKPVVNIVPVNQGKAVTEEESRNIFADYLCLLASGMKKKDCSEKLQEKYGRGKFSIKNILDKNLKP